MPTSSTVNMPHAIADETSSTASASASSTQNGVHTTVTIGSTSGGTVSARNDQSRPISDSEWSSVGVRLVTNPPETEVLSPEEEASLANST